MHRLAHADGLSAREEPEPGHRAAVVARDEGVRRRGELGELLCRLMAGAYSADPGRGVRVGGRNGATLREHLHAAVHPRMHEAEVAEGPRLRELELVRLERRGGEAGVLVRLPVGRASALREGVVGRDEQARLSVEPERDAGRVTEARVGVGGIRGLERRPALTRGQEGDGVNDAMAEGPAHGVADIDRDLPAEEAVEIQFAGELRRSGQIRRGWRSPGDHGLRLRARRRRRA